MKDKRVNDSELRKNDDVFNVIDNMIKKSEGVDLLEDIDKKIPSTRMGQNSFDTNIDLKKDGYGNDLIADVESQIKNSSLTSDDIEVDNSLQFSSEEDKEKIITMWLETISLYTKNHLSGLISLDEVILELDNFNKYLAIINYPINSIFITYLLTDQIFVRQLERIINELGMDKAIKMLGDNYLTLSILKYNEINEEINKKLKNSNNNSKKFKENKIIEEVNYCDIYGRLPVILSKEEEIFLIAKAQSGDKDAFNDLILFNLRLVLNISNGYFNNGIPISELVQEGVFGLQKSINMFEINKGTKFSSYASFWIKSLLGRYLENNGHTIRKSSAMLQEVAKVKKTKNMILSKTGKKPTNRELALQLGISLEKIEKINNVIFQMETVSLNQSVKLGDEEGAELGDMVADDTSYSVESEAINTKMAEEIKEILDSGILNDREREVIMKRYGFYGAPLTLQKIGDDCGLTRERIRQIEVKALKKLRTPFRNKKLNLYLNDDSDM